MTTFRFDPYEPDVPDDFEGADDDPVCDEINF